MFCFFCSKFGNDVGTYYYKWCPYHVSACPACDKKYRETPIKICNSCAVSELAQPNMEFTKDRHKTYFCSTCIREKSSKCYLCNRRTKYNIDDYVGKYVVCEKCCTTHGYWNNSVKELKPETTDILPFTRRVGLELEGYRCNNFFDLDRVWSCVHEGTETVFREFTSPPMAGDAAVDALKKLCDFAVKNDWKVNERCGLHLHVDVGDLSEEQLVSVLTGYVYSYPYWCNMVTPNRVHNRFCRAYDIYVENDLKTNPKRLPLSAFGLRYYWVSFESLLRHNTIEIRNHEGTFKFNKIFYWTLAHLTFIDWCSKRSMESVRDNLMHTKEVGFNAIMGPKITRYYKNKRGLLNMKSVPLTWVSATPQQVPPSFSEESPTLVEDDVIANERRRLQREIFERVRQSSPFWVDSLSHGTVVTNTSASNTSSTTNTSVTF